MTLRQNLAFRALLFLVHKGGDGDKMAEALKTADDFIAATGATDTEEVEASKAAVNTAAIAELQAAIAALPTPVDSTAELTRLGELLAALAADVEAVKAAQVVDPVVPEGVETQAVVEEPAPPAEETSEIA